MECFCQLDETEQTIYTLEFPQRPWTTNAERAGNRWERAKLTKEWRSGFLLLAKSSKIPQMAWITVTVEPHQKNGRLQDVGACNPSVKAAVDGLIDAQVLPDDSPEFVRSIVFLPPKKGKDSLVIHLRGVRKERQF
jgi:crossover junction endodeoxyribonuclease RusA